MAGERTLPGLGLTAFWDLGSTYKDAMDTNLRVLSALVQGRAISRTTALPGTPTLGDIYIVVDSDPTNPNKVAIWDGESGSEAWVYLAPAAGWMIYVTDESTLVQFDGAAWAVFSSGGGGGVAYADYEVGFGGAPGADEVIRTIAFARDVDFPADLVGSVFKAGVAPTADYDIEIIDVSGPTVLGTITISTANVATFDTSATIISATAGDIWQLVCQTATDASIDTIYGVMAGEYA